MIWSSFTPECNTPEDFSLLPFFPPFSWVALYLVLLSWKEDLSPLSPCIPAARHPSPCCLRQLWAMATSTATAIIVTIITSRVASPLPGLPPRVPKSVPAGASPIPPRGERSGGMDTVSVPEMCIFFFFLREVARICPDLGATPPRRSARLPAMEPERVCARRTSQPGPRAWILIWAAISMSWCTRSGEGVTKSNWEIQREATESCNLKFQYYYYH